MTTIEAIDADLTATRVKWLEAVQSENRAAETVCMHRLNFLLAQRWAAAHGQHLTYDDQTA